MLLVLLFLKIFYSFVFRKLKAYMTKYWENVARDTHEKA